jgi:caa(3)-type oxidase subunit IV
MTTDTHSASAHHGPGLVLYLVIFAALSIFTVVSFAVNDAVRSDMLSATAGFVLILGVAVCKALLVATVFMHLKYDWGRVYFMIVPALVLGALLCIVLMPDVVLAWHYP